MPRLVDQLLSLGNVDPMGGRGVFLSSWVIPIKSVGLIDKHADTPTGPKPLDLGPSFGRHHGSQSCCHQPWSTSRDSVCGLCGWTRVVSLWVGYGHWGILATGIIEAVWGFPGGLVVKNLLATAERINRWSREMPWCMWQLAWVPQLLSQHPRAWELQLLSPSSQLLKSVHVESVLHNRRSHRNEKPEHYN